MDKEVARIDKGTPFIVLLKSEEGQQLFVVIERQLLTESNSLANAVLDLIASYFVFDIVYHQTLYPVLIFI